MSIPLEHDSVPTKAEEMSISPFTQHHQSHYGSLLSYIKESGGKVVKEHDAKYRRGSSAKLDPIYRIYRELRSIHQDKTLAYISVEPIDGALDNCLVSIEGPPDSPYAGGVFWLHLVFPPNYPMTPFNLRFITPIYHPNICSDGTICHSMFNADWSPVLSSEKGLLSIVALLDTPNFEDALASGTEEYSYQEDYPTYFECARIYTEEYAHGVRPDTSDLVSVATKQELPRQDALDSGQEPTTLPATWAR